MVQQAVFGTFILKFYVATGRTYSTKMGSLVTLLGTIFTHFCKSFSTISTINTQYIKYHPSRTLPIPNSKPPSPEPDNTQTKHLRAASNKSPKPFHPLQKPSPHLSPHHQPHPTPKPISPHLSTLPPFYHLYPSNNLPKPPPPLPPPKIQLHDRHPRQPRIPRHTAPTRGPETRRFVGYSIFVAGVVVEGAATGFEAAVA